jgi:hypothetical protein
MADSIDWTDRKFRTLDELARIAFPEDAGITADTLKRRARQGKLTVYRPGKAFVSTLADVWAMIQATRVKPSRNREPSQAVPNALGLTETDLANLALDRVLSGIGQRKTEAKQPRDEERARAAHRLKMQERRRARARAKYQKDKADRRGK